MLISIGQFGPRSTTTSTPALDIYFDNVLFIASTSTPSPTPTATPTYTPTPIYTNTPTPIYTYTPTATPVASPTSIPSPLRQVRYTYDGDGNLVKSDVTTQDGTETITYYVSGYYNVQVIGSNTTVQKFYTFGSQTVAVQTSLNGAQNTLNWLLSDNLNSTTVTANADGTFNSELRYSAFGEIRYSSGSTPTNYQYTGQLSQQAIGLDYYIARWFDPVTAHFAQADTEVPDPGEPQTFDRYMYSNNNPITYNDPTGHDAGMGGLPYWERNYLSGYDYYDNYNYYNYDPYSEFQNSVNIYTSSNNWTCFVPQINSSISNNDAATLHYQASTNYYQPSIPVPGSSIYIPPIVSANSAQWASDATSIGPVIMKGLPEGANFTPTLSAAGAIFGGISQYEKDRNFDYTNQQLYGRAAWATFESGISSYLANGAGAIYGGAAAGLTAVSAPETIPWGPAAAGVVGYAGGYLATDNALSVKFNDFNEKTWFPAWKLSLDPSKQVCPVNPSH